MSAMDWNPSKDLDRLADRWGAKGVCMPHPWVPTDRIPVAAAELEAALREVPPELVFVRIPGKSADAGELPRVDLGIPGQLEQRLLQGPLHVLGLNLQKAGGPFGKFLENFLDHLQPVFDRVCGGQRPQASLGLFLSSPFTVVPYHADPEHNFLFQLASTKKFHIFPNRDLQIFPSIFRERLAVTRRCVLPFEEEFQTRAETFDLQPGSSTYQPPLAPHWVESGDGIAVSLAVSLYTPAEERERKIHVFNSKLRRLKIEPTPVGDSPVLDAGKEKLAVVFAGARHALLGTKTTPHFS